MDIKSTVKTIFLKIANKLGLELQDKTDTLISFTDSGFNPTAIGSATVTNITLDDSDIRILGNNARAKEINDIANYYSDDILGNACQVALGTGDVIVRPYTDGQYIGLNIIGNDNFVVTESIGTHLKGVIMQLDSYEDDNGNVFGLYESQTLKNITIEDNTRQAVYIRRFVYKNDKEYDISATTWKDMPTEQIFESDQLLFGRIKCPTLNREDYNSVNGVPITFGCEDIVNEVRKKYKQYNAEFDRKQSMIFADRTLFKNEKTDYNNPKYTLDDNIFMAVRGDLNGGVSSKIQDFNPEIREVSWKAGNDFNLAILELCCGFSRGIFTNPETAFATATEMKNSLKKTFAFVKQFRRNIESGTNMLLGACNIIMNINSTSPIGNFKIQYDWSYDYIEETKEKFNQLVQAHSIGAVKTEDVTAWTLNLNSDEAKQYVDEIKAEQISEETEPTNDDGIDDTTE